MTADDIDWLNDVEFITSSDLVTIKTTGAPSHSAEGNTLPVEVGVSSKLPLGRFSETITAKSSVDSLPDATLSVGGLVVGPVEASPSSIRFLLMQNAGNSMVPEFHRVQIINHDPDTPLKLTEVTDPDNRFDIEIETVAEGEQFNLVIRPKEIKKLAEIIEGAIVVNTNNPNVPELRVGYSIVPRL